MTTINDGITLTPPGTTTSYGTFVVNQGQTIAFGDPYAAAVYGTSPTIWRVTNLGSVLATGTLSHSAGIRLKAGGTVVNGSPTVTNARAYGFFYAIDIQGGGGLVTNSGTILSGSATNGGYIPAIPSSCCRAALSSTGRFR